MKTCGSLGLLTIRARSPSSAPPLTREDGSTAITATLSPAARQPCSSALVSVDFPTPGGPVTPVTCARADATASSRSAASSCVPRAVSISANADATARLPPALISASDGKLFCFTRGSADSFADEMQDEFAPMRRAAMLEQINSLPRTKREFAVDHRNGEMRLRQSGANMRRHVIRPLGLMLVKC
jgi:hypothetical protein